MNIRKQIFYSILVIFSAVFVFTTWIYYLHFEHSLEDVETKQVQQINRYLLEDLTKLLNTHFDFIKSMHNDGDISLAYDNTTWLSIVGKKQVEKKFENLFTLYPYLKKVVFYKNNKPYILLNSEKNQTDASWWITQSQELPFTNAKISFSINPIPYIQKHLITNKINHSTYIYYSSQGNNWLINYNSVKKFNFLATATNRTIIDKEPYLITEPLKKNDWYIQTFLNQKTTQEALYSILLKAILLYIFTAFIILFVAKYLSNLMIRPLKHLEIASKKLIDGDFTFLEFEPNDETRSTILAFNSMSKRIQGFTNELKEKVKQRTEDLEKALKEQDKLNKELVNEKNKAQEATTIKSNFLANMSHEIRTPINGIVGMTHLALETKLDNKQSHFLNTIDKSAKTLLGIINDILDFSKIEAGKLKIDKIDFNLENLIKDVSNLVAFKADEKDIDFDIEYDKSIPVNLYGDSLRISQVLINLINNAIKFTKHGYVKVKISNQNEKYTFEIKDSGIGIRQEEQSKLFHSFSQADGSTTRNYGGTGLGLSISKQLVELMGGEISVKSEPNKGSVFTFTIPLAKAKNNTYKENKYKYTIEDIQILPSYKILLVEDNKINQDIILGLLEDSKIKIDIVSNGKEAIDIFKLNKYKIIFMDIQMPIMNGIEATKIIRKIDKDIPIIALTANAMKEDIEKTKAVGMNHHLTKPINIEELYKIILKYIPNKSSKTILSTKNNQKLDIPNFYNIDIEKGLSYLAGNKKLYLKILNDFYNTYKNLNLEILKNDELKRVVHTLKGLSENIGALRLHAVVKELDTKHDLSIIPTLYHELQKVIEELKVIQQQTSNENKIFINDDKVVELFIQLKKAVKLKRPKIYEPIIEEIGKYSLNKKDMELINKVVSLLKEYNFNEAINLLQDIN